MKVLFTGASSFTGYWFVRELIHQGHEVSITLTGEDIDSYQDARKSRVEELCRVCTPIWSCKFGQRTLLDTIEAEGPWDMFCHHAADVTNYKSMDFNVANAVSSNTSNVAQVLRVLSANGCNHIALTGSVFEQNEGAGNGTMRAFSPYGLSKGLTADIFSYWCEELDLALGKFVIPNPFGPEEEPRFTAYLVRTWLAYVDFVQSLAKSTVNMKLNPSGYVESQGAFATRFSREMSKRFNLPCELQLNKQTDFSEPLVRINTEPCYSTFPGWDESLSWDSVANYYLSMADK